ncbi:MAG: chromosome segregation protein SMC [Bacteroidales bacterium]|nr:chromosome segregation protein SMC [Anaerotignum sp.]MCI5680324.1 chromosome segregation protein SMC [Bacteroidales bacterium]MDY3926289.1 chromosome segregation protein SMC [Anaerotignum sp.]
MYLKRLDLQGFKSFPEKVKLEFNPGVTAVVGPNGSGKSNVSDAVRWVLGEQRAKSLRGDKMEDIIFAGTENRKPLGFAEVSILIDNQDGKLPLEYSEVQVTRRVFRSGESEYRINGTACRLKDIQELFMDTGVGREGYSIIGQGRIDEILSAKGEERRRIFEEAAGIVKYKTRKNEAANKLEKEQQNLLRVDDIIGELEVQVGPLEQQSEKAKEYLRLKEHLKQAEMAAFCKDAERIGSQLEKLEQDEAAAREQMADSLQKSGAEKETAAALRERAEELDSLLQQQNEKMTELRGEMEKTEGEIRLREEQRQNDAANRNRIEGEMAEKARKQAENEAEQELCQSKMAGLRLDMDRQQEELDKLEEKYASLSSALSQNETKAESFKDEIFEQIRIGTEAKGEISKREAMMEQFLARKEQLLAEKEHTESRLHQYEVHLQALEKQENDRKEHIQYLEQELDALEQDRAHAAREKQKAEASLSGQEKRISETRSRLSLLMEMEREHEGFYNSVKSLLNLPDKEEKGICGAVGQLLKVEEEYETAIEAALGGALQNVVTETEEDAKDAIQYLKKHNLGRATFLPVTAIKGRPLEGKNAIMAEVGVIGTAYDLVTFDEKFRQIALNLLGRIIVVHNLDKAVQLAKKYRHQYKLVTLEGDILNPGGAMTGGSAQKKALHVFGRSREIRNLREALQTATDDASMLREKLLLANDDLQEIEEETVDKKMELQKVMVTLTSGSGEKEKTIADKQEAEEKLSLLQLEETQLTEQLAGAEGEIASFREAAEASEKAMADANEQLASFQSNLTGDKEERDALMEEITRKKIDLSSAGQNIYSIEKTLLRLKEENAVLMKDQKKAAEQLAFYEKNTDLRAEQQEDLKQKAADLHQQAEALQECLNETAAEKAQTTETAARTEAAAAEWKETAGKLENELFRISTKKEKLEEEKQRITTQMWEEYEMTLRMAQEYAANLPEDGEKRTVKEWKNMIRALGDVNVGAIEQYKEVKERYEFLTAQREDILEAEEKLRQIIEELSVLMEKQFREQFAVISENFSKVFQEMFGGGKAYLKLMDTEHVLESPIEIVAQPPGKNLQNMQLLSGGERALTAIAILFSILKMKPSPFCILDEIEAALDDANVSRFAQYLKRFSEETQFIVITHRKGTMEQADVLYGVTMQEKGISKLISVDFSDAQKDALVG